MKIFKLDLMTVLLIVVIIGVAVTMTTQANDQASQKSGLTKISVSVVDSQNPSKHRY